MSVSAEALTLAPAPEALAESAAPLARVERLALGVQLTLAMLAGGLVVVALGWEWAFPRQAALASLVAGAAAVLVAGPVMMAALRSLSRPSLHGVTDLLVAVAMTAAFAVGDLTTAALVPIVMIFAHVLEERSLVGSREAIRALGRLTETTARRLRGGAVEIVSAAALKPGDRIELRAGDRAPADGIVRAGSAAVDTASLTGESAPAEASAGATILAGSIDVDGRLEVEVDTHRLSDDARAHHRADARRRARQAAGDAAPGALRWTISGLRFDGRGGHMVRDRRRPGDARRAGRLLPVRAGFGSAGDLGRGDRGRRSPRDPDQGRRVPGNAERRRLGDVRQDRHADDWRARADAPSKRPTRKRRCASPRRSARRAAIPRAAPRFARPSIRPSPRTCARPAASASPERLTERRAPSGVRPCSRRSASTLPRRPRMAGLKPHFAGRPLSRLGAVRRSVAPGSGGCAR